MANFDPKAFLAKYGSATETGNVKGTVSIGFDPKAFLSQYAPAELDRSSEVPQLDASGAPIRQQQQDAIPDARPEWARESPTMYNMAAGARDILGPTIEGVASTLGGAGGFTVGGPFGAVAGAGLGYGIGKEITSAADVALGRTPERKGMENVTAPMSNVAEGALFEGAGGPVVRGLSQVLDVGKRNALRAKKIAEETLGGIDIPSFRNMLAKGGGDISAAQTTESVGKPAWQALNLRLSNRTVPAADFKYATQEAQEAARQAGIRNVTPDLAESITAREQMSKPFYDLSDKAIVAIDDPMRSLFQRMPSGTLRKAAEIAKMDGRPFIIPGDETAGKLPEITGESMHYIKRALSDLANAPASAQGMGRDAQNAARGVLQDFIQEFETRVPAYKEARSMFSELSKPVNQSKVLDAMLKVLEQPGGGERVLPFLNALGKGETALLKKATGFARFETGDLSKILTPQQMAAVDDAVSQMTRDIRISDQAAGGLEALRDVLSNNLKMLRLPSLISFKATITNALMEKIEKKVGDKVIGILTDSLKTAKTAEEMLSVLPAAERIRVIKIINDVASDPSLAKRAIRSGANVAAQDVFLSPQRNQLAPNQQPQNALAR
jgi:hypothetical protein